MDILFGQDVAATDDWVGALEGVVLESDTLAVLRIVTSHGFWRRSEVDIAFDLVATCSVEGVVLSVSKHDAMQGTSDEAQNGNDHIELFDSTSIATDRSSLKLKGVRIGDDDHIVSALILHERGNEDYVVAVDRFTEIQSDSVVLDIAESEIDELPMYRIDSDIEFDIREDLSNTEELPDTDLAAVRIDVREGIVALSGNVRESDFVNVISNVALSVAGVMVVNNQVASDWNIILGAADIVSEIAPELAGGVSFHSQLGVLNVYGHVDSDDLRNKVMAKFSEIAGVKCVVDETEIHVPVAVPAGRASDDEVSEELEDSPAE